MANGFLPEEVDHINGNRSDNRPCNLRQASRIENAHNLGVSKKNKTGVTGVSYLERADGYVASICVNWEIIYLGYFKDIEPAIEARKKAEKKYNYHRNHGRRPAEGVDL